MWKITKLGDICKIQSGNSIPVKEKESLYRNVNEGLPYVATKDVGFDGVIDYENGIRIPPNHSSKFRLSKKDSILVCAEGGSAGRKIAFSNKDCHLVNKLFSISPGSKMTSKYVYYYTLSKEFQGQFKKSMHGLIGGVSLSKIKNFHITYPPLSEQQRIVATLDAVFAEIDKTTDINLKKEKETKFLIERINNKIFNELKNNSNLVKLSSVIKFENGDRGKNYPSKKHQFSVGIPFINAGDLSLDGEITEKGMVYINEDRFKLLGAGKIELDDILFCLRGSLGKCALNKTYKKGAIASSLVIMRPEKKKILPKFLLAYLRSGLIKEYIRNTASGTAQPNLSAKTVGNYEIPLPSIEKQELILNKIENIKEKYFILRKITSQKKDELEKLKSSILLEKLKD